jgi:ribosomal protein S18 acetylase RimI-like enzyme
MQIIAPTAEHVPLLQSLMRNTFTETFGHLYPPADLAHYLDTAYDRLQLTKELSDPRNFWQLILDESGAPVGYLECLPAHLPHPDVRPDAHGEIERIYVLKSQQGRGLGRTLMELALAHLGERYGDAPQWLGVWSENTRAQALYRAYGFEKAGEYTFPVGETEDHEFIFRRIP